MPGLANSRHAPLSRHPTGRGLTTLGQPLLTVTPAPVDGGRSDNKYHGSNASDPIPPNIITSHSSLGDHSSRQSPPPHAKHELARYTKIIRRLQWKLPFLAQGYRLAIDRVGRDPDAVAEAELMFKLDFFEYYMLIERALVHLLGVFGVDVPKEHYQPQQHQHQHHPPPANGDNNGERNKGLSASVWKDTPRHRYHANVLAALDRADNPLHGTLGTGDVRQRLGRAKDLRNRWKTAGDDDHGEDEHGRGDRRERSPAGAEREWRTKKISSPLETYDLEKMLEVIFRGFDEAYRVAEQFVWGGAGHGDDMDLEMLGEDAKVGDSGLSVGKEDPWEFMVDAMDWEAV